MKHLCSAAIIAAWGIAPAAYALETDEDCTAFAQGALALQTMYTADPFEARYDPSDETCVIKDLTLISTRVWEMDFYIEEVLYESDKTGVERLQNRLPPQELDITLFGTRALLSARFLNDPAMQYVTRVQALSHPGSTFQLRYSWSPEEKRFLRFQAYYGMVSYYGGNELELYADIRGVDLSDWTTIEQSLGTARLHNLDVELLFEGMFENAVPYIYMLLRDENLLDSNSAPETQVEALKRSAVEYVTALPPRIFGTESRVMLAEFVETTPHPRGELRVALDSEEGLGATSFATLDILEMEDWLEEILSILQGSGSEVTIDWEEQNDEW